MFSIRSKLVSVLQPWLQSEPDLEVKLGFLRSHGIAKNLRFDISALNQLLDSSSALIFREVRVNDVSIRISPWSAPSFTVEVQGVYVTMAIRESRGERCYNWSDKIAKEKKEILSVIDPAGNALHDAVERISLTPPARNWLATSLWNVILKQCQLVIKDAHFDLQLPVVDDSLAYLLKIKEFSVKAMHLEQTCLLKGLFGGIFIPKSACSLDLCAGGVEIGLTSGKGSMSLLSPSDLMICIKLKDLKVLEMDVRVPQLNVTFSPVDLPLLLAFKMLSSQGVKCTRNGRELWDIAASRIGDVTLHPRLSLKKLVDAVKLWLRHVHAYESLLLLVGYPTETTLKESSVKMSVNKNFSARVKHQLEVVSTIEEDLPVEALARGRQVARRRAAMHTHTENNSGLHLEICRKLLCKFVLVTALLIKSICFIFQLILGFFSIERISNREFGVDVPEDFSSRYCFNFGELSVNLSPISAIPCPVGGNIESPHLNLLSLNGVAKTFFLIYTSSNIAQSLSMSCGDFKVNTSSSLFPLTGRSLRKETRHSFKGQGSDLKTILWSEPALKSLHTDKGVTGSVSAPENLSSLHLVSYLDELWSNWIECQKKSQRINAQHLETPFFLCEIKSFLVAPSLQRPVYGLWKCNLSMGTLNIDLGNPLILSLYFILKQIQHSISTVARYGSTTTLSPSPSIIKEPNKVKWGDLQKLYASRIKGVMLKMVPDKKIQIGVAMAGAKIRLSLQEEGPRPREQDVDQILTQGNDDFLIAFVLENLEFGVGPASKDRPATFTWKSGTGAVELKHHLPKESQLSRIWEVGYNDNFISQGQVALDYFLQIKGLTVQLEALEGSQKCQVIALNSVYIQSLSYREYVHSLTKSLTAISVSLCMIATGITLLSYMDELLIFCQMVECVLSAISNAFTSLNDVSGVHFQEIIMKNEGYRKVGPDGFIQASEKGVNLILNSTQFAMDASLELRELNIIVDKSRGSPLLTNGKKANRTSSNGKITMDVPEHGIAVSVQNLCTQILWEEEHIATSVNLSRIQSLLFRCQSQIGECIGVSELSNLLLLSSSFLYEFSLSTFTLALSTASCDDALSSGRVSDTFHHSISCSKKSNSPCCPLLIPGEGSDVLSCHTCKRIGALQSLTSNVPALPSCQFLIRIAIGEVIMVSCPLKKILIGAHEQRELLSSLSISGEYHTFSWIIQGGLIFLETEVFAMFSRCFSSYLLWIANISSILPLSRPISSGRQTEADDRSEYMDGPSNRSANERALQTASSSSVSTYSLSPALERPPLEALMIELSQFSLVLVVADGSGGMSELVLEADFYLKIELTNTIRKLQFDLHRLMILSRHLHASYLEHTKDIQILESSSVSVSELSSHIIDPRLGLQPMESVPSVLHDASSSRSPVPQGERIVKNEVSEHSRFKHGGCILRHGAASIMVENTVAVDGVGSLWLDNNLVGNGSVSGFDLTVSLSEIQMFLSLIAPLSGSSSGRAIAISEKRHLSRSKRHDSALEDIVPDGAIVAIQDIHQHMYLAVEGVENKYQVTGAIHYSLAGRGALFRVKYCNRNKWGSPALCFTLISLYAKSGSGEPLRLNFLSGSAFVDISGIDDSGSALWSTLDYKYEQYEADVDLESYRQSSKNTFYLVNKKNNCAIAFIDGVPEFVKKPGNPFKVKLFNDSSLTHYGLRMGTSPEDNNSEPASILPCANIVFDKVSVSVTIFHELPDANYKFPLLQVCVSDIQFIVQVLPSKVRLISTFTPAIFYFDAQGNLWRDIVRPVEMCVFYHSSFESQGSEHVPKEVPTHFYFRTKQVHAYLTEISWDILLFMAGELDLAGPYSVKSSMIFANCCKVENRSSLSLVCHFYDNQEATIGGKQVASIFLRQGVATNQFPENSSFVSVQLAAPGNYITSPIHVSIMNARLLAWRTRFVSLQDSRTHPGPFVIVDVSRKAEDGLSIVISPLLRIHNETGFSMELHFSRPQQKDAESVSVTLRSGDTLDDSKAAVDALSLLGGSKKTLMSLSLGNFLLSFRPEVTEYSEICRKPISAEWSEDLKGGKAVRLSGVFDKLGYKFRRVLGVESMKDSFSTVHCSLSVEGAYVTDLHFLIQTIGRDVPVTQPDNLRKTSDTRTAPVALQEQKEIFLLPTVQVSNNLQSEIHVVLSENLPDLMTSEGCNNIGKRATISCGSSAYLYANPAMMYFTVTLIAFNSSCKPVNSADWVKKLQKKKDDTHYLDIDLEFCGGKYYSSLRLSRGARGILEATVFTSYTLQNDSDLALFCFASNQKRLPRIEVEKSGLCLSPDMGSLLPPKSTRSWFLKSSKVNFELLEEKASVASLDLDALSGFTDVCLESNEGSGVQQVFKLGIGVKPCQMKMGVPSQTVLLVPRYVISNEAQEVIYFRQCFLEEDTDGMIVGSKQKRALRTKTLTKKSTEISYLDSFLRKHRIANDDSSVFIQFRLADIGWSWSGPVCVASLGRFFLKFSRPFDSFGSQSNLTDVNKRTEYAVVHTAEEGSTLVLHFHRSSNITLPYRIENFLQNESITYYQKDYLHPETLRPRSSVDYVWDDLSLPHQLVVQITDLHLSREINMDKVRSWRPLFKVRQQRGLALDLPLDKKRKEPKKTRDESQGFGMLKIGYEVYADGATRVLHISEYPGRCKEDYVLHPCVRIQLRISYFAVHVLENKKQDEDASVQTTYSPVVVARIGKIDLDSMFTDRSKYNQIRIQSFDVDEKWVGAPFAAMLRRNRSEYADMNDSILQVVFILLSSSSGVKQVKYSSIVLQPVDLNIDEETLMRLAPFWRTSTSDKSTQSRQFYFEHFEIHPIKIMASFLPGSPETNYSSSQETLRSFIHSVIKIPAVKSKKVELNGILVTHALVTVRELLIKCAQHYSWYAMRAVYIAKGSPLLPPAFASIFDDSASSSLDVFFDPSSGLINLPGITLGMFKFVSKCIDKKGSSGTKRYFGDLGKTVKTAGSNVLFVAITEISDCILKGAEANGFNGMVNGFHQGILRLAMEPSLLGTAAMEGGPDKKIKLDRSPGIDELYVEGYLQAMLDTMYKQEYLRVRVIDNQVILKNLPPNSSLINEILDHVKSFLISKALLRGESSATSHPLRHLRGEGEWKIGPTVLTLWEHLFVSFAIRMLRKQAFRFLTNIKWKGKSGYDIGRAIIPSAPGNQEGKLNIKWGIRKFIFSGLIAYIDGRLCRCIPNPIARRIVSGFLLSLLDSKSTSE